MVVFSRSECSAAGSGMQITLTREQILEYAALYTPDGDDILGARMEKAEKRGHMTREDLIAVSKWKWPPGTGRLCAQNTEAKVKEISAESFATKSESLRIGVLRELRGVDWSVASVILHFAFPKQYPNPGRQGDEYCRRVNEL